MKHFDIYTDLGKETVDFLKQAFESPIQLQICRTDIFDGDVEKAKERHKEQILQAIVYSKYGEFETAIHHTKTFSMSGFLEQKGRLPSKDDQIKIIRGKYYFEIGSTFILSEIGFLIIEPNQS